MQKLNQMKNNSFSPQFANIFFSFIVSGGYGYAAMANFPEIHQMAYLTASLCCVGALGGLSSQKTSRLGNILGIVCACAIKCFPLKID